MNTRTLARTLLVLLVALVALGSGPPVRAQNQVISVWNAKAFTTAGRTDTSATISARYAPRLELAYYTAGTDSCRILTTIDYLIGSVWQVARRDTLNFGAVLGTTNKVHGVTLIHPSTTSPMPGSHFFRVRTTITPFRVADSTSATKLYMTASFFYP